MTRSTARIEQIFSALEAEDWDLEVRELRAYIKALEDDCVTAEAAYKRLQEDEAEAIEFEAAERERNAAIEFAFQRAAEWRAANPGA